MPRNYVETIVMYVYVCVHFTEPISSSVRIFACSGEPRLIKLSAEWEGGYSYRPENRTALHYASSGKYVVRTELRIYIPIVALMLTLDTG